MKTTYTTNSIYCAYDLQTALSYYFAWRPTKQDLTKLLIKEYSYKEILLKQIEDMKSGEDWKDN